MGAAVMGGRDAERAGCIADKSMRWTGGRRKHFHGVVESKVQVQGDQSIIGVLLVRGKVNGRIAAESCIRAKQGFLSKNKSTLFGRVGTNLSKHIGKHMTKSVSGPLCE